MRLGRKPIRRQPIHYRPPLVSHLIRKLTRRVRPPNRLNPTTTYYRQALSVLGLWTSSAHLIDPLLALGPAQYAIDAPDSLH
jgi:hypothetical protein